MRHDAIDFRVTRCWTR